MSHTHAGANTNSRLEGRPGTELIAPYLEHLTAQVCDAVLEARSTTTEAFVTYGHGRCGLAANRDFWDAEAERYACGYNPDGTADDTLLVARATDGHRPDARDAVQLRLPPDHARLGEPAALARLRRRRPRGAGTGLRRAGPLPPGRLGRARAARRLRRRPGGRRPERPPAGPRRGGGDRSASPRLARASSTRGSSRPARTSARGPTGRASRSSSPRRGASRPCSTGIDLARKEDLGVVESLSSSTPDSPQEREKAMRRELLRLALGDEPVHRMPIWAWRLGEALLLALPNEPYSVFQVELRRRFAGTPLLVLMTTNGGVGYLPPTRDLRLGPLPGAAVAVCSRVPRAGDRSRGRSARRAAVCSLVVR